MRKRPPSRLVNTPEIELWPAPLLRARGNHDARALARAHTVLRRKRDGRYLAADLAEGIEYVGRTERLWQHLAEVGHALNSSLRETVPTGTLQMIAAGSTPVIRNWPVYRCVDGAATAFPQARVVDTPQEAAEQILAHGAQHHQPNEKGTHR